MDSCSSTCTAPASQCSTAYYCLLPTAYLSVRSKLFPVFMLMAALAILILLEPWNRAC